MSHSDILIFCVIFLVFEFGAPLLNYIYISHFRFCSFVALSVDYVVQRFGTRPLVDPSTFLTGLDWEAPWHAVLMVHSSSRKFISNNRIQSLSNQGIKNVSLLMLENNFLNCKLVLILLIYTHTM